MAGATRRGFTLIELLIVLAIVGVVIAIILPVLGGARNTAKRAATLALLNDLSNGSQQFVLDERRTPGYFNAFDMGAQSNSTRGFMAMENVLLDLSGGITTDAADDTKGIYAVGPKVQGTVNVNVNLIAAPASNFSGTNTRAKGYFVPDKANFVLQDTKAKKATNVDGHLKIPDLVDSFGTPILAWQQDDVPAGPTTPFAAIMSTKTLNGGGARFYWASNAGFLNAAPGKMGKNQKGTSSDPLAGKSMVGGGNPAANLIASMTGILGHPSFPDPATSGNTLAPGSARGGLIFHAAGTDGYFVGSTDKGGKVAMGRGGQIKYTSPDDAMIDFDDLMTAVGN
ncbi:MAG: type II secretion system protein [Phycisphaerae bacterium]|nr:type II secretion system protein [Phycisphaerae bacterium]